MRDVVGGRSAGYERSLRLARESAIEEMVAEAEQLGADALIGVDVDYESIQIGQGGGMLMVSASGTAVTLWRAPRCRCSKAKLTATGLIPAGAGWTKHDCQIVENRKYSPFDYSAKKPATVHKVWRKYRRLKGCSRYY